MVQKNEAIERRKKIWLVLSEFYLDTELTSEDFDRISTVFRQSGYVLSEIKEIDLYEVFPLLQMNLLSNAGEWAGFDEDWLISSCGRCYCKRRNWYHRLTCKFWNNLFYWMRKHYWIEIDKRMAVSR